MHCILVFNLFIYFATQIFTVGYIFSLSFLIFVLSAFYFIYLFIIYLLLLLFFYFYFCDGTGQEQTAVTIASVQQAAAFSDHNIQYQFRTEGGQVCNQQMKMSFLYY